MVKKIRQKLKQLTVTHLDLPKDVVMNLPRMTIVGLYQIYIENYQSVIQFTEEYLHLKLTNKQLKITGEKLVIRQIWTEEILVEGIIKEIKILD